jgi:formate hydrogenlyase subunit 3/multisubunit Na+/H+ antiporter MnhD subunit
VPPGSTVSQGVLRYLLFQTLAMPFVILAGWALVGVDANPSDANLVILASIFLGLGFAFWLAVFPFYTWLPLLSGQAHPYAVGFLYLMLPTANLLLGLDFMNAYGWLRNSPQLYLVLRLSGTLMVGTAGMLAAFQRDLGRLFGYAVIVETGFSLLAVSLDNRLGQEIFTMMFLPRMIALGLWALSASAFLKAGLSLRYEDLSRAAERLPVASAGLAAAYLSIAGLPLLAAFPNRQVLLQEIAVHSPFAALWVLVGTLGMLFSGFRLLAILTGGYFGPRKLSESRTQIFLMVVGMAALVLIGVFPRLFLPMLLGLLKAFTRLPG